jgi:folate-binding protein YgfZ
MTETASSTKHPRPGELAALRVTGQDALQFLQGQLTNDLELLAPDRPLLAGWNTPKGRLLCIMWVAQLDDSIALVLPAELAAGVRRRLTLFVLRADVQIQPDLIPVVPVPTNEVPEAPDSAIFSEKSPTSYCFKSGLFDYILLSQAPQMALRIGNGGPPVPEQAYTDWRRLMIRGGMPSVWTGTADSFVPQMVNLDLCGGISFKKGCYVGQEIVARTQNLGRIKRRMFGFSAGAETACAPGDPVVSAGETVGEVVDAVQGEAETELLAVVRLDAATSQLELANPATALVPRPLPYALA